MIENLILMKKKFRRSKNMHNLSTYSVSSTEQTKNLYYLKYFFDMKL